MTNDSNVRDLGQKANWPRHITWKGWLQIIKRVKTQIGNDNIDMIAAGVAFYFFLALFPSLTAIISIYGMAINPGQLQNQLTQISLFLPEQSHAYLSNVLQKLSGKSDESLGLGAVLSLLISFWVANRGTVALFKGINIAYDEGKSRGFINQNAITLLFTLGGLIVAIIAISFVIAYPAIVSGLPLPDSVKNIIALARWPVLGLIIIFSLAIIYKYAPNRKPPKFRWVSYGSVFATLLWLLGSLAFSYFVDNIANFDRIYGPLAAVVILLLWFMLTSFLILTGAEINAQMEHQTAVDSTRGKDMPIGERGAFYADRVADKK